MKKLLEFLQEQNGDFSSARLFAFSAVVSCIVDWQHAVWTGAGVWHPDLSTIGLVLGTVGFKVAQKFGENKEPK